MLINFGRARWYRARVKRSANYSTAPRSHSSLHHSVVFGWRFINRLRSACLLKIWCYLACIFNEYLNRWAQARRNFSSLLWLRCKQNCSRRLALAHRFEKMIKYVFYVFTHHSMSPLTSTQQLMLAPAIYSTSFALFLSINSLCKWFACSGSSPFSLLRYAIASRWNVAFGASLQLFWLRTSFNCIFTFNNWIFAEFSMIISSILSKIVQFVKLPSSFATNLHLFGMWLGVDPFEGDKFFVAVIGRLIDVSQTIRRKMLRAKSIISIPFHTHTHTLFRTVEMLMIWLDCAAFSIFVNSF